MSNWIEGMKGSAERENEALRRRDEIRIIDARIIRVKAPVFLDATLSCIKADAEELRMTFPADTSRQCGLAQSGDVHSLQSGKIPITVLNMRLDAGALCVEMWKATKYSRTESSDPRPMDAMRIVVGLDDEIEFIWRGKNYTDPAQLSEALIRFVCNLPTT